MASWRGFSGCDAIRRANGYWGMQGCQLPACRFAEPTDMDSPPEATLFIVSDNLAPQTVETRNLPALDRPLQPSVREIGLLGRPPWVRPLGKLTMEVSTQGWKFPTSGDAPPALQ